MDSTTRALIGRLPPTFKARYQESTHATHLLGAYGQQLWHLDQETQQLRMSMRLLTMDVNQVYEVYRGTVPEAIRDYSLIVESPEGELLQPSQSFRHFVSAWPDDPLYAEEIHIPRPYWIDLEDWSFYTRNNYEYVTIKLVHHDTIIRELETTLQPYPVWNEFDEAGLLYSLPRIKGEDNHSYKSRLLDVRRLPGSSDRVGLLFAIHRYLGLAYEDTWPDMGADHILDHEYVLPESIWVNNRKFPEERIRVVDDQTTLLLGTQSAQGETAAIRYYAGIRARSLLSSVDQKLRSALYTEGSDMSELDELVQQIHAQAPILWHERLWDESFWPPEETAQGLGVMPVCNDIL